jgi:hypothetical protein
MLVGALTWRNIPLPVGLGSAWVWSRRVLTHGSDDLPRVTRPCRPLHDELQENGGFGLTHTARVQRTSGGTFTAVEVNTLVEAFTYFCWLCAEARCGPFLPVGFDGQDSAVWSRWNPTRTESFTRAATWLDTVHASEAEALFPAFMTRFADPNWREVVIHAVKYLVEAGRPNTLQRAIVMAQILLETLSYSWLVEERALRTHASFEKHTAQRQRVDRCGRAGALGAGRAPAGPGACQPRAVGLCGISQACPSSCCNVFTVA